MGCRRGQILGSQVLAMDYCCDVMSLKIICIAVYLGGEVHSSAALCTYEQFANNISCTNIQSENNKYLQCGVLAR